MHQVFEGGCYIKCSNKQGIPHLNNLDLPLPTGSHGLQIWMALSKQREDVEPSFHHGQALPLDEYSTLVVGQANGVEQSEIFIDPNLGRVVYVDMHFSNTGSSSQFNRMGGDVPSSMDDTSLELGIYVSTGSMEFQSGWGDMDGVTREAGNMMVVSVPNAAVFEASIAATADDTRVAIMGGTPLPEKRHMVGFKVCSIHLP